MSAPFDLKARLRQPFDRELVQAEVARAAAEDRVPFDWKHPNAPAVSQPLSEDVFTSGDLTLDLMPDAVEYPITINGKVKKLWVHPVGDDDQMDILRWTLGRDNGEEPRTKQAALLKQQEMIAIAQRFQVIACCRTGPRRDAKRCFQAADFAAVGKFMPRATIAEIVSLSERLTGGGEAVGAGVRRFFGVIRSCLLISASLCSNSENCPDGFAATLTRLESLATRAMKAGVWDSSMSEDLDNLPWQP